MLHSSLRYSAFFGLFALVPACGGGDDDPAGGTGGTAGMSAGPTCTAALTATPENNYVFSSTLTVDQVHVKPSTELTLDWSGVTTDFLKRPVGQIDMVAVTLWKSDLATFEAGLNNDTLNNPLASADILPPDGATSSSIFELMVPDGKLSQESVLNYLSDTNYPPADYLFAIMIAKGEDIGKGTYMLSTFQVDPASTNTTVKVTSDSTKVAFTADIASRPVTSIPAGTGAVTIDWGKMKKTASGGTFIPSSITRLRIGHYTQTPTELEGDIFLQLDEVAAEMYEAPVEMGSKVSFDTAMTKDKKPFAGIDDTGTWIVALNCNECQNPAPWYLSVLKPCASP